MIFKRYPFLGGGYWVGGLPLNKAAFSLEVVVIIIISVILAIVIFVKIREDDLT